MATHKALCEVRFFSFRNLVNLLIHPAFRNACRHDLNLILYYPFQYPKTIFLVTIKQENSNKEY